LIRFRAEMQATGDPESIFAIPDFPDPWPVSAGRRYFDLMLVRVTARGQSIRLELASGLLAVNRTTNEAQKHRDEAPPWRQPGRSSE
jgi:hypothetical protein